MFWSIVLNVAERSRRQRHDIFKASGIDEPQLTYVVVDTVYRRAVAD